MSRQLDAGLEKKQARRNHLILLAVEYGLEQGVEASGGVLQGFSARLDEYETLITLRALVDGKPSIAFVGASTLGDALAKAAAEGKKQTLNWREDKWG